MLLREFELENILVSTEEIMLIMDDLEMDLNGTMRRTEVVESAIRKVERELLEMKRIIERGCYG